MHACGTRRHPGPQSRGSETCGWVPAAGLEPAHCAVHELEHEMVTRRRGLGAGVREAVKRFAPACASTHLVRRAAGAHACAPLRSIFEQAREEGVLVGENPCRIRGAGVSRWERMMEPLSIPQLESLGRSHPTASARRGSSPPGAGCATARSSSRGVATWNRTGHTGTSTKPRGSRRGRAPASRTCASTTCVTLRPYSQPGPGSAGRADARLGQRHLDGEVPLSARCPGAGCRHRGGAVSRGRGPVRAGDPAPFLALSPLLHTAQCGLPPIVRGGNGSQRRT